MVCFRYIIVNIQHKGNNKGDDDNDDDDNNNNTIKWLIAPSNLSFI